MNRVVLATMAAATAMGQQAYEHELAQNLPSVAPDLTYSTRRISTLRSTLAADLRLPLRAVMRAPLRGQNAIARMAYGRADLVHRCDLRLPAARREVVTVHDLAPLRFSDEGELPVAAAETLHSARRVICPSHFAASELRDLLGITNVVVIHNGVDPSVFQLIPDAPTLVRALGYSKPFIMQSGGATQRKNLAGLADAWRIVSEQVPELELVLCGPPDDRRTTLFKDLPRVRLAGRVDRVAHLALMTEAKIVVVPSTYEGFGFPAVEAMARETPVVSTDCASLPEVCGDAALLTRPTGDSLAAGVLSVLADEGTRDALVAAGRARAETFSWRRSAVEHADVYRSAMGLAH